MSDSIVIWGAGRIGRGFVADLFSSAGYSITFIERSPALVEALREAKGYTVVRSEDPSRRADVWVPVQLICRDDDTAAVRDAVGEADLLAVAVFPADFRAVAAALAPALAARAGRRPEAAVDIIVCANLSHAAAHFREALINAAAGIEDYVDRKVGVVDSLVMRMVVDAPDDVKAREPLLVWTNGVSQFPVDASAFRGPLPRVTGLRGVTNFAAEETRKLYTYNMCHAALAYLGALRGHSLAVDALADPMIFPHVEGALEEVSRALQAEYGFTSAGMSAWNEAVLRQTANPTLGDRIARQAADPRRKLRRADRLIGPLLLARRHGLAAPHLCRAVAAALYFRLPGDAGAEYVQDLIASAGVRAAVQELCELHPEEADVLEAITEGYAALGEALKQPSRS